MKKLLIAIAASSLLSGCCVFGFEIDKTYKEVLVVKLPNAEPKEVNETYPDLAKAIEICFKEAIIKCEKEKKDTALSEEDTKSRSYQNLCKTPDSRSLYTRYKSGFGEAPTYCNSKNTLDTPETITLWNVSKFFKTCMEERGYYKTKKVVTSKIACKPLSVW